MSAEAAIALADARAQAYDLFAALLGRGLTADRTAAVAAMPELAAGLDALRDADGALDLDAAAAEHHRLFGLEVSLLVSAFVGPEGRAGGPAESQVQADLLEYTGRGPADLPGDHLAAILTGLGRLCGAEADALQDGLPDTAVNLAVRARRLLDRHLLPVLPAMRQAVHDAASGLFPAVVDLTDALVSHHREALGPADPAPEPAAPPTLEALLTDEGTGLKDVVGFLLSPARSGLWLPRGAVVGLGRDHEIPSGFGRRQDQLEALLFGAIDRDAAPEILEGLESAFGRAASEYARWADDRPASVAVFATAWRTRAEATARGLARMRADARQ